MKVKMLLDGGKARVPASGLRRIIEAAGLDVGHRRADIGVVVGGDGIFSRYGRTEDIPLLFVGVRSKRPTGSKAVLSEVYFDELPVVLPQIKSGNYRIEQHRRLRVFRNGKGIGEVFTDAYLQRGGDSNCLRYRVKVRGKGVVVDEWAIGDGLVVSTAAGSTGYYSYPDRIKDDALDPMASARIGEDEMGVCHIVPTFTQREREDVHPLRYKVPWGCTVEVSLTRPADARLYGTTRGRGGVRVGSRDIIAIGPANDATKVISLRGGSD